MYLNMEISSAQQTFRRYERSIDLINILNLPVWKGSSRELHPYRLENTDYLSQFPIWFQGCFQCGSTSQLSSKDLPKDNDVEYKRQFWKKNWIHKPHTKKNCTHPRGSIHTYGPSTGHPARFETNKPLSTLSNHGITIKRQDNTPAWITHEEKPSAYT